MAQRTTSKAAGGQTKPADIRKFHAALHTWYEANGRHTLPWRTTDDAYRIWLSEVMLQQTQVATVLARFYQPFLNKFPTIRHLADAPRESVMKAWEGLGYYRRAGNLHEAAKQARNGLPKDFDALLALPGIGRNTAHAVLAFAYHQPVAILEANVKRVVARIFARTTPSDTELWAGAELLLNRAEPFHYNQAMMDLGSLICTPKNPDCPHCPANIICAGKAAPGNYPAPKQKKSVPTREVVIHVRADAAGRLFLEAREAALLGGLYGFPQTPRAETPEKSIGIVTHVYSHFKLIGHVVMARSDKRMNSKDWHSRAEIIALPLSKLDHKVLALVDNCHSAQKKPAKAAKPHKAH
jgi:A/G-specific adenine glycosylase